MAKLSSIFNSNKFPDTLIIVMIIYLVLEIVTRLIFRPQLIPEDTYTKFSPHYDYGFDEKLPLFYESDGKLQLYATPYLSFWKQEMAVKKEPGSFRIFTIGSSVSRGDQNSNYSYFLEKYLNVDQNKKFEVINCSATGIGSSRILLIFKKILQYEPDFVIFHLHGSNEFEDERDLAEAAMLASSYEGILRKSWFFCVTKKYLDEKILNKFKEAHDIDPETYARWFVPGKREEWIQTLEKNTAEIVHIAKEYQVPVLFVNRVFRTDSIAGFEDDESIRFNSITKKFIQPDVNLIDTPELFYSTFGSSVEKDSIFLDAVHLQAKGHKVIARKIADMLKEKSYAYELPAASPILHHSGRSKLQ